MNDQGVKADQDLGTNQQKIFRKKKFGFGAGVGAGAVVFGDPLGFGDYVRSNIYDEVLQKIDKTVKEGSQEKIIIKYNHFSERVEYFMFGPLNFQMLAPGPTLQVRIDSRKNQECGSGISCARYDDEKDGVVFEISKLEFYILSTHKFSRSPELRVKNWLPMRIGRKNIDIFDTGYPGFEDSSHIPKAKFLEGYVIAYQGPAKDLSYGVGGSWRGTEIDLIAEIEGFDSSGEVYCGYSWEIAASGQVYKGSRIFKQDVI